MLRRYIAEFIGTFAYVFFGCGVKILQGHGPHATDTLPIYLTFGLTLFATSFALGHISAAPFNPAITFGSAVVRRFPWRYLLFYWSAQILGALTASFLQLLLIPDQARMASFGATIPTVGEPQAVIIEAIITFFLMLVYMASMTERRVTRAVVGLAMGLTVTCASFFASSLTGGSMNPARSLAPALFAGGKALAVIWIYWVGPLFGAGAAALLYEFLRGGKEYATDLVEGLFQDRKRS